MNLHFGFSIYFYLFNSDIIYGIKQKIGHFWLEEGHILKIGQNFEGRKRLNFYLIF